MPVGKLRQKVLYGTSRKRGMQHLYSRIRILVAIVSTLAVAALPIFDILRFDVWSGRHVLLGEQVSFSVAAKAFAYPFLGINIGILIVSKSVGRYLCGFACPYGAMTRLREWIRFRSKDPLPRLMAEVVLFTACALLGAVVFSFWVHWDVFMEGSSLARLLATVFLGSMVGGLYMLVRVLGMGFCRGWCPSGAYFALLGADSTTGIEFEHPEACIECDLCDKVCPTDLKPREMSGGAHREGIGLYAEGMSNFANCIRCGDCVTVCEVVTAKNETPVPLRMGVLPPEHRESRERPG